MIKLYSYYSLNTYRGANMKYFSLVLFLLLIFILSDSSVNEEYEICDEFEGDEDGDEK